MTLLECKGLTKNMEILLPCLIAAYKSKVVISLVCWVQMEVERQH